MDKPLISVIVPVYNVEDYIEECIDSLIHQTYKNIEIILIDDGSTDSSGDICDKYASQHSNIVVLHKENGGLSSARNAGLDIAKGYYIGFVDSDDFVHPEMYEKLEQGFSYEGVGIVSCGVQAYDGHSCRPFIKEWNVLKERIVPYEDFAIKLLTKNYNFTVWSKIFHKSLLDNVRFEIGRLNEDSLFIFELSHVLENQHVNMLEIPYSFYYYRQREGSITKIKTHPLEIDVIDNYKKMGIEAMAYNKRLAEAIFDRRAVIIYDFLYTILRQKHYHSLYAQYSTLFSKEVPVWRFVKKNKIMGRDLLAFCMLRFFPQYYLKKYFSSNNNIDSKSFFS